MKRLCDHKFMSTFGRRLFLLMLGLATFASGSAAWAQAAAGKTTGGNGNLEAYLSAGFLGLSASSTQIDLSPGFNFKPLRNFNWLQVGGEITYQKISFQGGSASNVVFAVGPTFNVGNTTGESSFFSIGLVCKAGSASYEDPSAVDPNGLGFYLIAGHRFPLSVNLSMRPSIGVESAGSSALIIRPLALSFIF
jgi:hypothetical protein